MNKLAYLNNNQVEQPFRHLSDLFYSVPKESFVYGISSGLPRVWHRLRCHRELNQHPSDHRGRRCIGATFLFGSNGETTLDNLTSARKYFAQHSNRGLWQGRVQPHKISHSGVDLWYRPPKTDGRPQLLLGGQMTLMAHSSARDTKTKFSSVSASLSINPADFSNH